MKRTVFPGGCAELRITSADPAKLLKDLTDAGVEVFHTVFENEISFTVTISCRDRSEVERICRSRGGEVRIRNVKAPAFRGMVRRPVLCAGLLLLLWASIFLPSRIFFLEVEGNLRIPDRQILEAARQCGMEFGASRRQVRSEKVKNALLEAMPELQWAGVNTYGCVAKISVRERALETQSNTDPSPGHIVAILDAVITECTALRGTLMCAPGQAVEKGQVLISGLTDSGLSIRLEQARGEIYGQTCRTQTAAGLQTVLQKGVEQKRMKKISFFLGKKRINLWKDSGIWDTTCDRMYEEYYITLPGGFVLPFGICVERYSFRESSESVRTDEAIRQLLSRSGEDYLKSQMTAGRILSSDLLYEETDGTVRMSGEYLCLEMIGKMQRMEIGE